VAKQSLKMFYDILKSAQFKTDEIQFSYIHKNIQSDFVDEIAKKYSKMEKSVDNNVFFFCNFIDIRIKILFVFKDYHLKTS
jgi:hypothetical protein